MGRIRIGVSGWRYDDWRGDFYPAGLRHDDELAYAASRFDTLEINGTFYGLSTPGAFHGWAASVPDDFVFAVKGSRFITHNKKLRDVRSALANFFASGVLELDHRLGPILWQLPARLRFERGRVDDFLAQLPHDTSAAVTLAKEHDDRVAEVGYGPGSNHRVRHVIEVRHDSFLCEEMVTLAHRHGVAIACSHSVEWPYLEQITAGFVYVRLHGPDELYASGYGEDRLAAWAKRLEAWRSGDEPSDAVVVSDREPPPRHERDVYVYFDNDGGGHAPRDATRLRQLTAET
jgi:uncharacterized protein YecE (DUF72 family)